MKPREWWIASPPSEDQAESMVCCDGPYADGYENVQVIEKSAYLDLLAQAEAMATELKGYANLPDGLFSGPDDIYENLGRGAREALAAWQKFKGNLND